MRRLMLISYAENDVPDAENALTPVPDPHFLGGREKTTNERNHFARSGD